MGEVMGWAEYVKHFSPVGDPGLNDPDGTRMSGSLMATLDAMREEMGVPFIVTAGFRILSQQEALKAQGLAESLGSAHLTGEAVDGYFPGLPLLAMFAYCCRWPFRGLGLYPFTEGLGGQPVIHLDVQDRGKPRNALWIRNRVGRYVYAPGPRFVEEIEMLAAKEKWER